MWSILNLNLRNDLHITSHTLFSNCFSSFFFFFFSFDSIFFFSRWFCYAIWVCVLLFFFLLRFFSSYFIGPMRLFLKIFRFHLFGVCAYARIGVLDQIHTDRFSFNCRSVKFICELFRVSQDTNLETRFSFLFESLLFFCFISFSVARNGPNSCSFNRINICHSRAQRTKEIKEPFLILTVFFFFSFLNKNHFNSTNTQRMALLFLFFYLVANTKKKQKCDVF